MRKSIIEAAITGIHLVCFLFLSSKKKKKKKLDLTISIQALGDSDGSLDTELKTEDLQTENVKVTPKKCDQKRKKHLYKQNGN